jgi:hypothetical protein
MKRKKIGRKLFWEINNLHGLFLDTEDNIATDKETNKFREKYTAIETNLYKLVKKLEPRLIEEVEDKEEESCVDQCVGLHDVQKRKGE